MLASIKTTIGVGLLSPLPFFGNPTMIGMARLASQHTWGWIAFCAGVLHLTMLYVNGTWRRSPHLRALCSGIGTMFWFQVCIGFSSSPIPTTAWLIYPWLFIFSVRNVVAAMQDARSADDYHKGGLIGGSK
ncbi:hypothetical protein [Novosphingobium sp. 9]|uniref:hypothetical protein n=1 Tax=Novosphingobium sp. 9 TaxID=2025349 RepID=UPI0021B65866|nr:hypothetical protein [Novosphingobium sp. 9]